MTSPVAEAALAAVAARLTSAVPSAATERARRAPIDLETEALPRLVVHLESSEADATMEPGSTYYRLGFTVVGYAIGTTDLDAQQAVIALHALTVAALAGWTPSTAGLGDVSETGAEFLLHDTEQSSRPAGEFMARFEMLATTSTGNPYL